MVAVDSKINKGGQVSAAMVISAKYAGRRVVQLPEWKTNLAEGQVDYYYAQMGRMTLRKEEAVSLGLTNMSKWSQIAVVCGS